MTDLERLLERVEGRVLNKHRDAIPSGAVYIGRGSPWGNPYVIGRDGDRDQVCDLYEANVLPTLDIEPLRGKDLVCFCAPQRCHGDSIRAKLALPQKESGE